MKTQGQEPEVDPFLCRCRKCKNFWRRTFSSGAGAGAGAGAGLLNMPSEERVARTSMMYSATRRREDHPAVLKVGDRVIWRDQHVGVVKFVGILDENMTAPDAYVGIKTDDHIGSLHNGVYQGKRYFHCPRGHGVMAKYAEVIRINPPEKCPPLSGNPMFPSYGRVQRQRLERSIRYPEKEPTPPPYKKPAAVYICDEHDIAARDIVRREQQERRRQLMLQERERKRQIQEDVASRQSFNKYKEQFGGGAKGQVLAKTLQKLHVAYEDGLQLLKEEQEQENLTETESQWSDYHSSIP